MARFPLGEGKSPKWVKSASIRASCAAVDTVVLENAARSCWPGVEVLTLSPLAGDAGTRRYVRLRLQGGGAPATALAMIFATDGSARTPEEGSGPSEKELPFVHMHRFLAAEGIPVPAIFHVDEPAGNLLLEDLGDLPLAEAAEKADSDQRERLLSDAVRLLTRFNNLDQQPSESCTALTRTYGRREIQKELEVTARYGLGHAQGVGIRAAGADPALETALQRIGDRLAAQPKGLLHRDYHAWNLHLDAHGQLRIIDFQDAICGPVVYDLASLLTDRDTDRFVSPELAQKMLPVWLDEMQKSGRAPYPDLSSLQEAYFVAVAYRTLRVIGRFGVLALELEKPGYFERYAPRMARQTMRALDQLGEEDLAELLFERSPIFS